MEGWTNALAIIGGGGSSDYEFETGEYTPTNNIARPTISFAKTHDTTPFLVAMVKTSLSTLTDNSRNYVFVFFDFYRLYGTYVPGSASSTTTLHYAKAFYSYTGTSGSVSNGGTNITYNSDNTGSSSTSYSRYWVTASDFKPYSGSTSRYWGNGSTFKWIAIWKKTT